MATVPGSSDYLGPIRKVKISHIRNIIVSFRSFLVTLAPFALVTVILVHSNRYATCSVTSRI